VPRCQGSFLSGGGEGKGQSGDWATYTEGMKVGASGEDGPKLTFWSRQVPWMGVVGYLLTPVNLYVACKPVICVLDWSDMVWTFEVFWTPIAIGLRW